MRSFILSLLLTLPLSGLSPARSQTTPAAEATAGPSEGTPPTVIDEIIVTAQKREESLQKVPLAVTAFSSPRIEELGIDTPDDFVALIPNLSLGHSFTVGNSLLTMRGISQLNNSDPPAAITVDGVTEGNQKQFSQELFDIERIEVLKGPQGALYGRNSLAGAINIVTRQPGSRLEGFAQAGAGNGSSRSAAAAVRGPLAGEALRFSLAGSWKDRSGLIENVYRHQESDPYRDASGRFLVQWLPSSRASLKLRASRSDTRGGAVGYSAFPPEGHANDFRFSPDEDVLGFSRRRIDDLALQFGWDAGAFSVTAITGATDLAETSRGDADFSNPARQDLVFPLGQVGQGQDQDVHLFSQEVRLASAGGALEWIAGAYLQRTERTITNTAFLDRDGTIAGFLPFLVFAAKDRNESYALFGQAGRTFAERWKVSAGLRFDRDDRRQRDLGPGLAPPREASFDAWQPKLTLSYQAGERIMGYLNLSTGFRSGGFNAPNVTPLVYGKESLTNYELGFKSSWLAQRLRLNGAAFLSRVDGFQYFQVDITRGGQVIDTIPSVRVLGFEADLAARLRSGWELDASFGSADSEIRDFPRYPRFVGNQTPFNTRSKASLGTHYDRALGDGLLASVQLDVEHRGRQFWNIDNRDVQDPLTLLNLRLGLESVHWAVTLWARNLTDVRYYTEYLDATWQGPLASGDLGLLAPPRSYGLEVRRRF